VLAGAGKERVMGQDVNGAPKLQRKAYERELVRLQSELVILQEWVKNSVAVEAVADGPRVGQPLGGLLPGQGRDVRPHRQQLMRMPTPGRRANVADRS
jgi:hypothetical protein